MEEAEEREGGRRGRGRVRAGPAAAARVCPRGKDAPEPQALEKGGAEPPMPCSEGQSQVAKWTGVGTASKLLSRPQAPHLGPGQLWPSTRSLRGYRAILSSGPSHRTAGPPVGPAPAPAALLQAGAAQVSSAAGGSLASGSSPPPPAWAPPTLLFWMRRIRCSKQLLLRKVVWSTGRSSHASIKGMASAEGHGSALPRPLPAAPTPAFNLLPILPSPAFPQSRAFTSQGHLPKCLGVHTHQAC